MMLKKILAKIRPKKKIEKFPPEEFNYPEHKKLSVIAESSQAIGEFLEWMINEKEYSLAKFKEDGVHIETLNIEQLLIEFFNIDLKKIEQEKKEMLRKQKIIK